MIVLVKKNTKYNLLPNMTKSEERNFGKIVLLNGKGHRKGFSSSLVKFPV